MDFAKVQILGHVGGEPKITTEEKNGETVMTAVMNVATNSRYRSGEDGWQERANWHRVVVRNKHLAKVVQDMVGKGSQVQLFGNLESRSWEENGEMRYITEVVLAGPEAQIIVHKGKEATRSASQEASGEEKAADTGEEPGWTGKEDKRRSTRGQGKGAREAA